jgi:osomolarity two-component system response regulator SSK1
VLTTGQLPPLMSPGGRNRLHISRQPRPQFARQITSSPTGQPLPQVSRNGTGAKARRDSTSSEKPGGVVQIPRTGTPPIDGRVSQNNRPASPRPSKHRAQRRIQPDTTAQQQQERIIKFADRSIVAADIGVPPINVLIVEDNMINMKLLEQFVRRLKVNWAIAINGKEAVEKWRMGGFHLVLMDIQLPIMNGIDATKEIRRLERVNGIGVLSKLNEWNGATYVEEELTDGDVLREKEVLFKSPVIIVALTASNLQSDRHEALAAGCNDFLTKASSSLGLSISSLHMTYEANFG